MEHKTAVPHALVERARAAGTDVDPAHDFSHVLRVTENVRRIAAGETLDDADTRVAVHAAMLHELFNYPKAHPESHLSGDVCAEHAATALAELDYAQDFVDAVTVCIRDHGFSKGVLPNSTAARILQDADRLDAIGAIGVARWAATCAAMGTVFYAPEDPFCHTRMPDDKQFGVDHFYRKLLKIEEGLHTETARQLARQRGNFMRDYLQQLRDELPRSLPSANPHKNPGASRC
jgi:uncharacterized protein